MNWGKGITIFYVLFMAGMISMVVFAIRNKSDLVVDNYYEKDINYEKFRKKRGLGEPYKSDIKIGFDKGKRKVIITWPKNMLPEGGEVTLYHSHKKNKDLIFPISLKNDIQELSLDLPGPLPQGKWIFQFDWIHNDSLFYVEKIYNF